MSTYSPLFAGVDASEVTEKEPPWDPLAPPVLPLVVDPIIKRLSKLLSLVHPLLQLLSDSV